MASRDPKTIRSLGRVFKTFDDCGQRKVNGQEFLVGLSECGCNLTSDDSNFLLCAFDTGLDGNINFDKFLTGLRGSMNVKRQAICDTIFDKFECCYGDNVITAADIKSCFNSSTHPKVVSGLYTEDEALLEFLSNFGDKNNDGIITKGEWNDYYSAVSDSIENDDHFVQLMTQVWKL